MRIAHTFSGLPRQWWMTAVPAALPVADCITPAQLETWLGGGPGVLVRVGDEHWLQPEMLTGAKDLLVIDARALWLDDVLTDGRHFHERHIAYLDQCPPDAFTAGMPWVLSGDAVVYQRFVAAIQPFFEGVLPLWFAGPAGSGHFLHAVLELCRYRTLVQWQAWMGDYQAPTPERIAMMFRQDRHLLQQLLGLSEYFLQQQTGIPANDTPAFALQLAQWCVDMLPKWLEAIQ